MEKTEEAELKSSASSQRLNRNASIGKPAALVKLPWHRSIQA
jgi:hypothetical protein